MSRIRYEVSGYRSVLPDLKRIIENRNQLSGDDHIYTEPHNYTLLADQKKIESINRIS